MATKGTRKEKMVFEYEGDAASQESVAHEFNRTHPRGLPGDHRTMGIR
jgi:hypothetical protein